MMLSSKCVVCNSKKLRFVKEQEVSWLLLSLPIKTSPSHIPLVGDVLLRI